MSTIISFFTTRADAEAAAARLVELGFSRETISLLSNQQRNRFAVDIGNTPGSGESAATETGAHQDEAGLPETARVGFLVMVTEEQPRADEASAILTDNGGEALTTDDIDWKGGGWEPIDPYAERFDSTWQQSSKTGTVAGGVAGAVAGAVLGAPGGPAGMAAGGVIGAATGAVLGAGGDIAGKEMQRTPEQPAESQEPQEDEQS